MKIVVYIIFLLLVGLAGYVGAKGLISDDISREEKWAEYDRRNTTLVKTMVREEENK